MKRAAFVLSFSAAVLLAGTPAAPQSLSELFQTVKEQVKGGSWEQALSTLGTLQSEAARPGHEDARQKLEGPVAFYRGVCEANLGQAEEAVEAFKAFLRVEPDATIDSTLYSKKTVAAFEEARKSAGDVSLPLADAFQEFRVPPEAAERDRVDEYWADGPVRWIMTLEERKAWSALTDPNARVGFVEEFWAARSTLRGADGRTYREEFERRVAFADVHLVQDPEQRGSVTDRGMVFVLLGPPTWASRRPLRTGDDRNDHAGMSAVGSQDAKLAAKSMSGRLRGGTTSAKGQVLDYQYQGVWSQAVETSGELEVWNYRRERLPRDVPYQKLDVHYVTKKGYGNRVMQRDAPTTNTLGAARRNAGPAGGGRTVAARR